MGTQVYLYTDGACNGNPGPGGYAAILQCNGRARELAGGAAHTTNNRMELQAVIAGLQAFKRRCQVTVVTGSQYVATILNSGKARANLDLVEKVRLLAQRHGVTVQTLPGHSGHPLNERAEALAQQEARRWVQGSMPCAGS